MKGHHMNASWLFKIFKVVLAVAFFLLSVFCAFPETITEEQRKKMNEEWDKQNLYHQTGMVFDTSEQFIKIPKGMKPEWIEDIQIAGTPPAIEFAPVRYLDPMYFPEDNKHYWSNWAGVTCAPNGRFYFAEGDQDAWHHSF